MSDEPSGQDRSAVVDPFKGEDGLRRLLLDGLPASAAIVTVIAQPFAQDSMRAMLRLPEWLPVLLAAAVSGLLALYRVQIVRRASPVESAILVPLLTLVIFSAYATGNNAVYYLKEGYTRPAGPPGSEEMTALRREKELLEQQLRSAETVIAKLRTALGLPARQGSVSSPFHALLRGLGPTSAHAQEPRPQPAVPAETERRAPPDTLQQLRKLLQDYEKQQTQLDEELKQLREKRGPSPGDTRQQPLIKSW